MLGLLISILGVALWSYIFVYILKLEKIGCECALDWRRTFIQYYIIVLVLVALSQIANIFTTLPIIVKICLLFGSIAFITITFLYVRDLKKKKCECSDETARDVLEIVNYIQIGIVGFVLLIGIYMIYVITRSQSRLKNMKLKKM